MSQLLVRIVQEEELYTEMLKQSHIALELRLITQATKKCHHTVVVQSVLVVNVVAGLGIFTNQVKV